MFGANNRGAAAPWITLAGLCGAFAVILGAASGHGVSHEPGCTVACTALAVDYLEKASRYAMYHGLALGLIGLLRLNGFGGRLLTAAGGLFFVGVVLFSGGLAALSLGIVVTPLVPIGGTAFIIGWLCLAGGGWAGRQAKI